MDNLRQKGRPIDFVELVGRTNEEVKEALQSCDFLVDQLYYDVAISYLATETPFWENPPSSEPSVKDQFGRCARPARPCRPFICARRKR